MPTNLTDVDTFTSPIAVPVGADARTAASVETPFQALANRTRNLDTRTTFNLHGLDRVCAGTWRPELSGLAATDVHGIAHDGARRWCLVGDAGLISTSDDMGETWTTRTPGSAFAGRLNAVHFAAGVFVAVGQAEEIQTSPDGVTWTRRNTGGGGELRGVAYDGTGWAAVGDSGGSALVLTAATATGAWAAATAPTSCDDLQAVASDGAGVFIAVGDSSTGAFGRIAYSADQGATWTSELAPNTISELYAVTYGGDSVFYAAGLNGDIISAAAPTGAPSSSDWTVLRSGSSEPGCYGIAAPAGGFVVVARGGITADPADPIIGHADGTFSEVVAPTEEGAICAHYAAGMVMIGLDGGGVLRSGVFGHRLGSI